MTGQRGVFWGYIDLTPQIVTTQDAAAQTYLNTKKDSLTMITRIYGSVWILIMLTATSLMGCQQQPSSDPTPTTRPINKPTVTASPADASNTNKNTKPTSKPTKPRSKPTPDANPPLIDIAKPAATAAVLPSDHAPIIPPAINHQKLPSTQIYNSLMQQAAQQRQQGKLAIAMRSYQQAQQLRPRTAAPYARLSELALQQGNAKQAEQQARAGLHVAQGNTAKKGFWLLIALSLDAQGKPKDAALARYEASRLR